MKETILAGTIVGPRRAYRGYIALRDGRIREVAETRERVEADLGGILLPPLVNAHTHVGDAVALDPPLVGLERLVGPGGLKHRLLAGSPPSEKARAMREAAAEMARGGCLGFADFREEGLPGVRLLRRALRGLPARGLALGRPADGSPPASVLAAADGFGLSSAADLPERLLEECRRMARRSRKVFALHAGERSRDDIEPALALEPDFLVHLTQATPRDLRRVADAGIPVAVCPRSNFVTGAGGPGRPPLREMRRAGVRLALGTDNVMLNRPDLFAEMEFTAKALLPDPGAVLGMATAGGASILGAEWGLRRGKEATLAVLDERSLGRSMDLRTSVVLRARAEDVKAVVVRGRVLGRRKIK